MTDLLVLTVDGYGHYFHQKRLVWSRPIIPGSFIDSNHSSIFLEPSDKGEIYIFNDNEFKKTNVSIQEIVNQNHLLMKNDYIYTTAKNTTIDHLSLLNGDLNDMITGFNIFISMTHYSIDISHSIDLSQRFRISFLDSNLFSNHYVSENVNFILPSLVLMPDNSLLVKEPLNIQYESCTTHSCDINDDNGRTYSLNFQSTPIKAVSINHYNSKVHVTQLFPFNDVKQSSHPSAMVGRNIKPSTLQKPSSLPKQSSHPSTTMFGYNSGSYFILTSNHFPLIHSSERNVPLIEATMNNEINELTAKKVPLIDSKMNNEYNEMKPPLLNSKDLSPIEIEESLTLFQPQFTKEKSLITVPISMNSFNISTIDCVSLKCIAPLIESISELKTSIEPLKTNPSIGIVGYGFNLFLFVSFVISLVYLLRNKTTKKSNESIKQLNQLNNSQSNESINKQSNDKQSKTYWNKQPKPSPTKHRQSNKYINELINKQSNQPINQPINQSIYDSMNKSNSETKPLSKDLIYESKSLIVTTSVLGHGSQGTIVFTGKFQERKVAVKRLLLDFYDLAHHEIKLLQKSDQHPNVIRYFYKEETERFLFIALEYCIASLQDVYSNETIKLHLEKDFLSNLMNQLNPITICQSITNGMNHLHSLNIIHRDLKPANILISEYTNSNVKEYRILLSDFGLSKKMEDVQGSYYNTSGTTSGTYGFRAPECFKPYKINKKIDIFSMGCVFYFVFYCGEHPFGNMVEREYNILNKKLKIQTNTYFDGSNSSLSRESIRLACDLVIHMVQNDPTKRPLTKEILNHPLFWSQEKRLTFLLDASDRFESESRDPPTPLHNLIETQSTQIIGKDWSIKLDPRLLEQLSKYRKYDYSMIRDLLRVLRNKKNHYYELPIELRNVVGELPDGYLDYFEKLFPGLFLHVYRVLSRCSLKDEPLFKDYNVM